MLPALAVTVKAPPVCRGRTFTFLHYPVYPLQI